MLANPLGGISSLDSKLETLTSKVIEYGVPRKTLTVDDWADRYRILSREASAEPGRWRTSRTPYMRQIMRDLSPDSPVKEVVVAKGAQIGMTELGVCWLGSIVDQQPGPILMVMPNENMAKKASRTRIQTMINSAPQLKEKFGVAGSKNNTNTILEKHFGGGVLTLVGSNSPSNLRSASIRYLFADEVDSYVGDVGGEGDPITLMRARTATYARNKKIFMISTPTIEGQSRIWDAFQASTQNYFYLPCPHCDHYQTLEIGRLKWMPGHQDKAALVCEECGVFIEEFHKTKMLAGGQWRPHNPGPNRPQGYHLNSLYSPAGWLAWSEILLMWTDLHRKKNVSRLRAFVNTVLGEPFRQSGEAPDWEKVMGRAEDYAIGTVPANALVLTAGVDVQKDRLEVEIVGWGEDAESWSIEHIVIPGDTAAEEPWRELHSILNRVYESEDGRELSISRMAVDSGYNTQVVYAWVRSQNAAKVMAVKGSDQARVPISTSAVDVTRKGKTNSRGLQLWTVGSSLLKQELYGWLKQPLPEGDYVPAGWCHFPKYSREYFKQLCAEEMVLKTTGGRQRYVWEKIYDRNEILDIRVYNRAAAISLGLDRKDSHWWNSLRNEQSRQKITAVPSTKPQRRKNSDFW